MWGSKASVSGFHRLKSSSVAAALALLAALGGSGRPAHAADIFEVGLPQPAAAIRQDHGRSYVEMGGRTFRLDACDTPEGLCLATTRSRIAPQKAPAGALPDGFVATARSGDIRKAWYARPTNRYAHGVLGDGIEGGSLVIVTADGHEAEFVLPESQVFEDITPRIADLDGDGANEVVTIRSSQTGGSAVAIYGLRDGELAEYGWSSENGRPSRWLNIAAIIPDTSGIRTIYAVRTPHIGGRLFSLNYGNGRIFERDDIATDVSNHIIGSRELGLSAWGDIDGDGQADLVLPSQDRMRLRFPLSNLPDIALGEPVVNPIVIAGGRIVTISPGGRLLIIAP